MASLHADGTLCYNCTSGCHKELVPKDTLSQQSLRRMVPEQEVAPSDWLSSLHVGIAREDDIGFPAI